MKKEYIDMYRPPGIIKNQETALQIRPSIDEKILLTVPTAKLFRRTKPEEKRDEKYERPGLGIALGAGSGLNNNLLGASLND